MTAFSRDKSAKVKNAAVTALVKVNLSCSNWFSLVLRDIGHYFCFFSSCMLSLHIYALRPDKVNMDMYAFTHTDIDTDTDTHTRTRPHSNTYTNTHTSTIHSQVCVQTHITHPHMHSHRYTNCA